ncbi:enhancer of mRNA-decapping protein 3-like [Haliotis rubra]|uniref:enhancer of mRNA-decapping protein 3-like n=1 Tax=Haliotis rubra TaxID=36100 RepID=UPI001EE561C8|nr:enhancer of mRNA-decapping protein 3-like [Haliotis rubra]
MTCEWVGSIVSLDCGEALGTYQGQVRKIDNVTQALTIFKAYRNGLRCEVPELTINAGDIKDLKILKSPSEARCLLNKQATPSKLSKEVEEAVNPTCPSPVKVIQPSNHIHTNGYHNGRHSANGQRITPTRDYHDSNGLYYNHSGSGSARHTPTREQGEQKTRRSSFYSSQEYQTHSSFKHSNLLGFFERLNVGIFIEVWQETVPRKSPTFKTDKGLSKDLLSRLQTGGESHTQPTEHLGSVCHRRTRLCLWSHPSVSSQTLKGRKSTTPRKIDGRNNIRKNTPREDCFSAPVESFLSKEFDFEKNLALFDKKAVFEEIENQFPEVVRVTDKKGEKYRCDENVLQSGPVQLSQIHVPASGGGDFVTDAGLVVPSITYQLRNKILSTAEQCGLSVDRQIEMVGRSASEMVLQLLGGSHRLNPQNDHQLPTVIVLCGPHTQGAQGISCARHLANHNVKTIVFVPNFVRMNQILEKELQLFEFCDGKKTSSTKELPTMPDMIVNALDSHENPNLKDQSWYKSLTEWARNKRAPCLAIDPPIEGAALDSKWSLGICLPLSLKNAASQMYLCDLGLPKKVFVESGVRYVSPFSHKFVIPLHRR